VPVTAGGLRLGLDNGKIVKHGTDRINSDHTRSGGPGKAQVSGHSEGFVKPLACAAANAARDWAS